jgi:tripartite-type tricarboxylate transporter receptor subunit TctC
VNAAHGVAIFAVTLLGTSGAVHAQQEPYPAKSIRLLVPPPPGDSNDGVARIVSTALNQSLGRAIVIDNRSGGGGIIASEIVARARADGYTLLFAYAAFTTTPFLQANLAYDVLRDFAPISEVADQPLFIIVHPSVQANTVRDLIALSKSKPGGLMVGFTQMGSSTHLATELFKLKTDTVKSITSVSYKGGAAAQIALLSGEVQIAFATATAILPQLKGGKIKVIATSAAKRVRYLPEVPTFEEAGVSGVESSPWQGLLAPAGTPPAIVNLLHGEVVKLLKRPENVDRLAVLGADPVGSSPAEFRAKLERELKTFGRIIPALGIKPQ